jgi:branched-chain amino acid transport system permease protein
MLVVQLLANGLVNGCGYALVALGFAFVYNTTRIFHFAHGAVFALAAYIFYSLFVQWGLPLILAAFATLILITAFGVLIDELVHAPLDEQGTSMLIHLLSSIGLYTVVVNMIALLYGNQTKVLSSGGTTTYSFGGVTLVQMQVVTVITTLIVLGMLFVILWKTRLGKMLRAMRDDPELVAVMGINPSTLRRTVFALGSGLAAVAAILQGLDVGIDPQVGLSAIVNGAVAVIIGGVGVFEGAVVGGFTIGLLQALVVWQASAQWQDAITFVVLILFLIFRPEGMLGEQRRVEEVMT